MHHLHHRLFAAVAALVERRLAALAALAAGGGGGVHARAQQTLQTLADALRALAGVGGGVVDGATAEAEAAALYANHGARRAVAALLVRENPELFGAAPPQTGDALTGEIPADISYLDSLDASEISTQTGKAASKWPVHNDAQKLQIDAAQQSDKRFLQSTEFSDLFDQHSLLGAIESNDSVVADIIQALESVPSEFRSPLDLSTLDLYSRHEVDELSSLLQANFEGTLYGIKGASTVASVSSFSDLEIENLPLLKQNAIEKKPSPRYKRGSKKFTIVEANTMTRSMFDLYEQENLTSETEHQELLGMEVEYFFQEADRLEKEKGKRGFVGASGKILAGVVKAITGAPLVKKTIYEEATMTRSNSSSSSKDKSSIESISNAIVVNTREAQWDSASKGRQHKPRAAAVKDASKGDRRRVGQLDSKLAGKSFVYGAKDAVGDGKNPVDVEVDLVLKEGGIGKLKAKL
ncbi:hypothetical protein BDR26DRAFT_918931 [Obelidium mucronatum]|nr:hypothetical protein BDR26DRAFT_918931 [Obelidium mucronatum]